jgi:hypothetical protein
VEAISGGAAGFVRAIQLIFDAGELQGRFIESPGQGDSVGRSENTGAGAHRFVLARRVGLVASEEPDHGLEHALSAHPSKTFTVFPMRSAQFSLPPGKCAKESMPCLQLKDLGALLAHSWGKD